MVSSHQPIWTLNTALAKTDICDSTINYLAVPPAILLSNYFIRSRRNPQSA
jgi:hypothetical protein